MIYLIIVGAMTILARYAESATALVRTAMLGDIVSMPGKLTLLPVTQTAK